MITREELLKSPDYWFEAAQNDLFAELKQYLDKENITQTELAERLNVSKGYISQIMNGNANFSMKKLIEFFILIGRLPQIKYVDLEKVVQLDKNKQENLQSNLEDNIVLNNLLKQTTNGIAVEEE